MLLLRGETTPPPNCDMSSKNGDLHLDEEQVVVSCIDDTKETMAVTCAEKNNCTGEAVFVERGNEQNKSSQLHSLRQWLRQRLENGIAENITKQKECVLMILLIELDIDHSAREKLKDTYDRSRYMRLILANSPDARKDGKTHELLNSGVAGTLSMKRKVSTSVDKKEKDCMEGGIFFRKEAVDFGTASAGSILRLKIELCNSTDQEVCIIRIA